MSESLVGGRTTYETPRQWRKLEGGITLGEDLRDSASEGEMHQALDLILPSTDFEVHALHLYDGSGEPRDLPTEVILSTEDPEDYTMEVFSVKENSGTTERTLNHYDDSINDMEVLHQIVQGAGHGYAHRTNRNSEEELNLGSLEGIAGEILKGKNEQNWEIEEDTRPWSTKTSPNPLDYYRMAPSSRYIFDNPEIEDGLGIYMDNYKDMIDMIVNQYEKETVGLENVASRNYEDLAESVEGVSEQGLRGMIESFPDQMEELYQQSKRKV